MVTYYRINQGQTYSTINFTISNFSSKRMISLSFKVNYNSIRVDDLFLMMILMPLSAIF